MSRRVATVAMDDDVVVGVVAVVEWAMSEPWAIPVVVVVVVVVVADNTLVTSWVSHPLVVDLATHPN